MKKLKFIIPLLGIVAAFVVGIVTFKSYGINLNSGNLSFVPGAVLCSLLLSIFLVYLIATKAGKRKLFASAKKTASVIVGFILAILLTAGITVLSGVFVTNKGILQNYLSGSMYITDYAEDWEYISAYDCYALVNVVYVADPIDKPHQSMSIFVPSSYMNADGFINHDGMINGYTADTAPIIYKNSVAGYFQAAALYRPDTSEYLDQGFVYISVGSRGSQSRVSGEYVGKAPEGLVDLKAGVRFLKYNDELLAGSSEKIISVGTSAGGAMSALLGVTGNSSDYYPYLLNNGAIMDATDDVFAAMAYCPITDLENADLAYEWLFSQDLRKQDEFNRAVSFELSTLYANYINCLELADNESNMLTLSAEGNSGAMYEYVLMLLERAASKFLNMSNNPANYAKQYAWLTFDGDTAHITSIEEMIGGYLPRMKNVMAFDNWDGQSYENALFGSTGINGRHFNPHVATVIESLKAQYPSHYEKYYNAYAVALSDEGLALQTTLMNPMRQLEMGTGTVSPYFRIRVGTKDAHTSWTIALALSLQINKCSDSDVDFAYVWDEPHTDADYKGEFVSWVDSIAR